MLCKRPRSWKKNQQGEQDEIENAINKYKESEGAAQDRKDIDRAKLELENAFYKVVSTTKGRDRGKTFL